jgi:hypothetical protein
LAKRIVCLFFSFTQVFFAIQIAIVGYCLIIYNFADKLNFKVPQKILDYEDKIKTKEMVKDIPGFIKQGNDFWLGKNQFKNLN